MQSIDKYWDDIHDKYSSTYDGWLDKYIHLFNKNDSIIELGCGRAYCSKYLLEKGFKNIIACDFSRRVLEIVKSETANLETRLFNMEDGIPFENKSINIVIADLSLHYFSLEKTKYILNEIYRILKQNGYLIARVNSVKDKLHIPENSKEIEKNFFFDGTIYKRFFEKQDFYRLLNEFQIYDLEEKEMGRYEKSKVIWELCAKK